MGEFERWYKSVESDIKISAIMADDMLKSMFYDCWKEAREGERQYVSYTIGTIIRIEGEWDYILACVDYHKYTLISLESGNRWTEPMRIEAAKITEEDINEMVGNSNTWEVVECDYGGLQ